MRKTSTTASNTQLHNYTIHLFKQPPSAWRMQLQRKLPQVRSSRELSILFYKKNTHTRNNHSIVCPIVLDCILYRRRLFSILLHGSAPARSSAKGFYQPFLIGINVVYLILRQLKVGLLLTSTFREVVVMLLFGGLHYACYVSILENAAASSSSSSSSSKKALVGGAALDYLAVILVIQFGSLLISTKFYWLLLLIPAWGAWTLYQTFLGGGGKAAAASSQPSMPADAAANNTAPGNRKQRRAEERSKERRK